MHYLVATDSVHATAAACDHLEDRVPAVEAVTVAAVTDAARDAGDATNVATARLAGRADVETVHLEGEDPASAVLAAVEERDVDAVVVGGRFGEDGSVDDVSPAVIAVLGGASVPVVVLPRATEP